MASAKIRKKVLRGVVISNKMEGTVVVRVFSTFRHPVYQKVLKSRRSYYAHCPQGALDVGQGVCIRETRPLSKLKRWVVI